MTREPRTREELSAEVRALLLELRGVEAAGPDDDLEALGIDSLARLDLLAVIERRFNLRLTEDLVGELRSVASIARVIEEEQAVDAREQASVVDGLQRP